MDEDDLEDDDVQLILKLNPTFMRDVNFKSDKNIYANVLRKDAGNRSYKEGDGVRCIIVSLEETERSITLLCRPATKAEREANEQ